VRDYEVMTTTATTSRQPKRMTEKLKPAQIHIAVQPMGAPGNLLRLQQQYGNRNVQRLVVVMRQGESAATAAEPAITPVSNVSGNIGVPTAQPTAQKTSPIYSKELLQEVTATVLAESAAGQEEIIAWIYYNHVSAKGRKGLNVSSAFSKKSDWYKVWLVALGDQTYARDKSTKKDIRDYANIGDFVAKHQWFRTVGQPRADRLKGTVSTIFSDPSKNPYPGWFGQGNLDDLNRDYGKWKQARQYLHLQEAGKVETIYVEILSGQPASVVFDEKSIAEYFKTHTLPKQVESYRP